MITWKQMDKDIPDLWEGESDKFTYYVNEGSEGGFYGFLSGANDISRKCKDVDGAKRWCERHYKKICKTLKSI